MNLFTRMSDWMRALVFPLLAVCLLLIAIPSAVSAGDPGGVGPPADYTITRDPYATAYEQGKMAGKLCVLIVSENCKYCPAAINAFVDFADASGGACVILDVDEDAEYAQDIKVSDAVPQLVVWRYAGEWSRTAEVIGADKFKIREAMVGPSGGMMNVPAEACIAGSCDSGTCAVSGPAGAGFARLQETRRFQYEPFQPVRNAGRLVGNVGHRAANFFVVHKPVRKGLRAVGYAVTRPFGGRFCCR